jgi:hypothetical protein
LLKHRRKFDPGAHVDINKHCSFNLVISALGKLLPPSWRSTAFGAGTAAGSFGQFLFSPLGVSLIDTVGSLQPNSFSKYWPMPSALAAPSSRR